MMATELGKTTITKLFAESIAGATDGLSWPMALIVLALVYFYAHYGFASITAHVTAMFIPFLTVTIAVGAPAGLTVLVLTYFANLSAGLTHYGTTPAPVYFGTGYVKQGQWWTIGLIASVLNILIWSTIGLALVESDRLVVGCGKILAQKNAGAFEPAFFTIASTNTPDQKLSSLPGAPGAPGSGASTLSRASL